jgi:hypothetical protein
VSAFLAESQAAARISTIPYATFHPCHQPRAAPAGPERGYHVTALCVHPKKLGSLNDGVAVLRGDLSDLPSSTVRATPIARSLVPRSTPAATGQRHPDESERYGAAGVNAACARGPTVSDLMAMGHVSRQVVLGGRSW